MKLFRNNSPKDVIFLEPVRVASEKLPRDKIRMLYCDAEGKVYTTLIDKTVYKLALDNISKMESANKDYATLGLEIGPGSFLPMVVEIGPGEVWALEHILGHARRSGAIPNVLKKQLKQIIKLGEPGHRETVEIIKKKDRESEAVSAPRVLNRLPYYTERDIEFSMPIYKSELSFPLLVMKRLQRDEDSHSAEQRLLILDNEGDLAVIKIPFKMIIQAEKRLEAWSEKSNTPACIILNRSSKGFNINFLTVSRPQKRALDAMVKRFEETGSGQQSIPAAAKKVLLKARDMSVSVPA